MTTATIRPATGTIAIARSPVPTGNARHASGDPLVPGWVTLVLMSCEVPLRPAPASPAAGPGSQGR